MEKKSYILRVWVDGQLCWERGPMEAPEALKAYWKWDAVSNCGPELLEDGRHMTVAEVERMDRRFRAALGAAGTGAGNGRGMAYGRLENPRH